MYAHGQPRGVNAFTLAATELLSDSLFMYVCAVHWSCFGHEHTKRAVSPRFLSLRLLGALSCDYDASPPTLVADSRVTCWQGSHRYLAIASLIAYSFYIPMSVMIAPIFVGATAGALVLLGVPMPTCQLARSPCKW